MHLWKKKKKLKNKCPEDILSQLDSLESSLHYDDIITFRKLAEASLQIDHGNKGSHSQGQQGANSGGGWFSWVWGGSKAVEEEEILTNFSEEEWASLYEKIHFVDNGEDKQLAANNPIPIEYEKMKASFRLESGFFTLYSSSMAKHSIKPDKLNAKILQTGFHGLDIEFIKRVDSMTVKSDIASTSIIDYYTLTEEQGTIEMVSLNPLSLQQSDHFLSIQYDHNPIDKEADFRVSVNATQSLNITCSREIIDRTIEFFKHGGNATQLKLAANNTWDKLKENAEMSVKYALDNRKKLDVQLDIVAPNLIIPSSFIHESAPIIILELGKFQLRSDLESKKKAVNKDNEMVEVSKEYYYDQFNLSITDIHAAVSSRDINFNTQHPNDIDILRKFDINLLLSVCTVESNDLPKFKINASLPHIEGSISPDKLDKLLTVIYSFLTSSSSSSKNQLPDSSPLHAASPSQKKQSPSLSSSGNGKKQSSSMKNSKSGSVTASPARRIASDKSKSQPQSTNSQLLFACFEFGKIALKLHREKDLLLTTVENFQLTALKSDYSLTVDLLLDNFIIEDKIQQFGDDLKYIISSYDHYHHPVYPIHTTFVPTPNSPSPRPPSSSSSSGTSTSFNSPRKASNKAIQELSPSKSGATSNKLVQIHYENIPKTSPKFDFVENEVILSFNKLDITVNRETLIEVLRFSNDCMDIMSNLSSQSKSNPPNVQPSGAAPNQQSPGPSKQQKDEEDAFDDEESIEEVKKKAGEELVTILIKAEVKIQSVRMNLIKRGLPFIHSALHTSVIEAEIHSNKELKVNGTVGSILVDDLSEDTKWNKIVHIYGDRILDFWFESINPSNPKDTGKFIVDIRMNSVEFIYLTKFLSSLTQYVNKFSQMQRVLQSTAKMAREKAEATAKEITKVIIFNIAIANPRIILPKSSSELEYIQMNLGDITVSNKIEYMPIPKNHSFRFTEKQLNAIVKRPATGESMELIEEEELLDTIMIKISSISALSHSKQSNQPPKPIIKECDIDLSVNRPITERIKQTLPNFAISIGLHDIIIELSESQLDIALGILSGNLSEVAVKKSNVKSVQNTLETIEEEIKLQANQAALKHGHPQQPLFPSSQPNSMDRSSSPQQPTTLSKPSYQVTLDLHKISLELFEGDGSITTTQNNQSVSTSTSFGMFVIDNFGVDFILYSDSTLHIGLNIQSVCLLDTRLNAGYYKRIIAPIHKSKNDNLLLQSTYDKNMDGLQVINVLINNTRLMVVPEFVWGLKIFSMRILAKVNQTLAKMKKNVVDDTMQQSPSNSLPREQSPLQPSAHNSDKQLALPSNQPQGPQAPAIITGMKMKVTINNPQLCLIEHPTEEDSRAIILTTSMSMDYTQFTNAEQKIYIQLKEIHIYKCRLIHEKTTLVKILNPFSIKFEYLSSKEGLTISADLEAIQITFAYSDFKLIMCVKDQWMKVLNDTAQSAKTPANKLKHPLDDDESMKDEENTEDNTSGLPNEASQNNSSGLELPNSAPEPVSPPQHAKININGVDILLIDDSLSRVSPLLSLLIEDTTATATNWNSPNMIGNAYLLGLEMNYYNNTLNSVEPMIEKWDLYGKFAKQNNSQFQVKLEAAEALNINITKSFVETLLNSLEQMQADFYDKIQKRDKFSPFRIRNDTGIPITYWITGSDNKRHVDPGIELSMDLMEFEADQRNQISKKSTEKNLLSVQLEENDIIPLHNLIFTKKVSYLFQDISSRDPYLRLLYNLDFDKGGSKILHFGSDIVIVNETVIPIQVQLESKSLATNYLQPILPGASCSIPIRYATSSFIRIRPNEFAYDWSNEAIKCATVGLTPPNKQVAQYLSCASRDQKDRFSPTWLFSYSIKGKRKTTSCLSFQEEQQVTIAIQAPFKLENTLPTKVFYQIKDPNGLNLTSGTLHVAEKVQIHQILPDHRPILFLKVDGFAWSSPNKIGGTKNEIVSLVNKQKQLLNLALQTTQTPYGSRFTTVYVNYWVMNQTGGKLFYRQPPKMGQNADSNTTHTIKGESMNISSLSNNYELPTTDDFYNYQQNIIEAESDPFQQLGSSNQLSNSSSNSIHSSGTGSFQMLPSQQQKELLVNENIYVKPFMYSESSISIKSLSSKWSPPIYLQQSGGVITVIDENAKNRKTATIGYQYGIQVTSGPGKFWRTSMVYIQPYYCIVNKSPFPIELKQQDLNESHSIIKIPENSQINFDWMNQLLPHFLKVRVFGENHWSSSFFIDAPSSFQIPVFITHPNSAHELQLIHIRIKIAVSVSSVVVIFSYSENDYPDYIINNHSEHKIIIGQVETMESLEIPGKQKMNYAWLEPLKEKKKLYLSIAHTKVKLMLGIDKLRLFTPIEWQGSNGNIHSILIEVKADGLTKIVLIKDYHPRKQLNRRPKSIQKVIGSTIGGIGTIVRSSAPSNSIHQSPGSIFIGSSTAGASSASLLTSSGTHQTVDSEATSVIDISKLSTRNQTSPTAMQDSVNNNEIQSAKYIVGMDFKGIGISIIDEKPQELILITISNIEILACLGENAQSFELQIGELQIDNQLFATPFPLLLYSKPVEKQPFFQMNILKSNRYKHLTYIPLFALKFQEIDFKMDEVCLLRLLNFIDLINNYLASRKIEEKQVNLFKCLPTIEIYSTIATGANNNGNAGPANEPEQSADASGGSSGALYFDLLHINPIRINLSFITTGGYTDLQESSVLEKTLRAGGFLANIDSAPLRLNGLIIKNPISSQDQLISRIVTHYKHQVLTEMYKLFGSIEILGSPISLVNNLGTGVYDFFHEPAEGIVVSPREFAAGLARGTNSLVKNSIFGVFNSASKISGSISKAATTISLDEEWKIARAKKQRNQAQHIGQGLSRGVKSLGTGLFQGVTGIVSQPIRGLANEGGSGFVKGVGKGVSGFVLRPVVGFVDFITDTTEGIKNSAIYSSEKLKDRKRPPRFISYDRIITPFDPVKSELQFLLRTVDEGKFESLYFIDTILANQNCFILFSDHRLFIFASKPGTFPKKRFDCKYSGNTPLPLPFPSSLLFLFTSLPLL